MNTWTPSALIWLWLYYLYWEFRSPAPVEQAVKEDFIVAGVLSGNRNFEGRIHPYVKASWLPPLVVAYALAGTVDIDSQPSQLARTKMVMKCI